MPAPTGEGSGRGASEAGLCRWGYASSMEVVTRYRRAVGRQPKDPDDITSDTEVSRERATDVSSVVLRAPLLRPKPCESCV